MRRRLLILAASLSLGVSGAGCGDPTLYPSYPAGLLALDTASAPVTTSVALLCGRDAPGATATLTLHNEGAVALDLYTVDALCTETFELTLAAGDSQTLSVANDLAWAGYDPDGVRVVAFQVPSGSNVQWVEYLP